MGSRRSLDQQVHIYIYLCIQRSRYMCMGVPKKKNIPCNSRIFPFETHHFCWGLYPPWHPMTRWKPARQATLSSVASWTHVGSSNIWMVFASGMAWHSKWLQDSGPIDGFEWKILYLNGMIIGGNPIYIHLWQPHFLWHCWKNVPVSSAAYDPHEQQAGKVDVSKGSTLRRILRKNEPAPCFLTSIPQ